MGWIRKIASFVTGHRGNCAHGTLRGRGGGKYNKPDIWGYSGGTYAIYRCEDCGKYFVKHRMGWQELNNTDPLTDADRIIFGNDIDPAKPGRSINA